MCDTPLATEAPPIEPPCLRGPALAWESLVQGLEAAAAGLDSSSVFRQNLGLPGF